MKTRNNIKRKIRMISSRIKASPKKKVHKSKKPKKERNLTYFGKKKKKIKGRWRTIHYYKDSQGKKHQKVEIDYRKVQKVLQPKRKLRHYISRTKTMIHKLPSKIMKGMKTVAKDGYEHSIAIDFERNISQPQRVVIMKGGEKETIKIVDFEMFGHTHPNQKRVQPSFGDLKNTNVLEPEFIIAGKTGQTRILNVEDPEKLKKFIFKRKTDKLSSYAVRQKDINHQLKRKKYKDDPSLKNIMPYNITETEKGREMFFDITGVRIYPLKENETYVEMKDDPHLEKRMPSIPKEYLEKYQKGRSIPS